MMKYSRREFGRLALTAVPAAALWQPRPDSRIHGVRIGAITYSFRALPADAIIPAYVKIGLREMEIMSNHAESLAGCPRDAAARREWRAAASEATFAPLRKQILDAGIDLRLLCYNMNVQRTQDDEVEYAFNLARWLGVDGITTSTQVSMAKRLAPFSDKHRIPIGFHGHADVKNPDEVSTPETFEAVMATSKYHWSNLDIGHFTQTGSDPVAFLQKHHARITNLHLKDKKKGGGTGPWGTGDTPIKECLKLLQKNKWNIPASIEFEYEGDPIVEVGKCFELCKQMLA